MLENVELFGDSLGVGTYPDDKSKSILQNIFDAIHPIGEIYIQYPAQKSPQEVYNKKDDDRIIIDSVWEEQLYYNSAFFRSEHLVGNYIYKVNGETQYYIIDNLNNLTPINIQGNNNITIAGSPTVGQQKVIGDKTYQAYIVSNVNSSSNNYIEEGNSLSIQSNTIKQHKHNNTLSITQQPMFGFQNQSAGSVSIMGRHGNNWASFGTDIGSCIIDVEAQGQISYSIDSSGGYQHAGQSRTESTKYKTYTSTHTHTLSYTNSGLSITNKNDTNNQESRPDNYTFRIWKRIA